MSFASDVIEAAKPQGLMLDLRQPAVIIDNLVFMHQLMVATEPLLALASDRMQHAASLFDLRYKRYLRQHALEERDHAGWLADDLRSVDVRVECRGLSACAAALAGGQY